MRVTLDSGVLVRAYTSSKGPAARLLATLPAWGHIIVVSPYILDEVRRVLSYARVRRRAALDPESIDSHLDGLRRTAEIVVPRVYAPVVFGDPNDDPVLYTAAAGKAEILCTLDRHFHAPNVLDFCVERGIRVMSDVELLRELETDRSKGQFA